MPKEFWPQRRDNATVVYAAILTMNGIILALSWGAFAKIYETISAPNFSTFLKEHGALDKFLFFVAYVHLAQLLALIASAGGLIITQFECFGNESRSPRRSDSALMRSNRLQDLLR
jgi:hypothetical protein